MNWITVLQEIASENPMLFVVAAILITLVPMTLEFLISNKKIEAEGGVVLLEKMSKRLTTLQDRCSTLEQELDDWRDKYYMLKEELSALEIENQKLRAEIEELKKGKG